MTQELIERSLVPMEVEIEGAEGRTLHARILRWDESNVVSDHGGPTYEEVWKRGVFGQSIKRAESKGHGWPLMYNHDRKSLPLGMVPMIHERSDGPWMTAKISKTSFGDDVIELVRDGAIPGISLGAVNIRSRKNEKGQIERMEVALREISMTPWPQLAGSGDMVLRATTTDIDPVARQTAAEFLARLDSRSAD